MLINFPFKVEIIKDDPLQRSMIESFIKDQPEVFDIRTYKHPSMILEEIKK